MRHTAGMRAFSVSQSSLRVGTKNIIWLLGFMRVLLAVREPVKVYSFVRSSLVQCRLVSS
jgi:hypothetical protein